MKPQFAVATEVSSEKSRGEIERILSRYGADAFGYGWEGQAAQVTFRAAGRYVRFVVLIPDRNDPEFVTTETGRERSATAAEKAWEQATRQRWRALALVIKAKLEATAAQITTFEEEFLAHIVLPNGDTVGRAVLPSIQRAYETGRMPRTLLALPPAPAVIEGEVLA